MTTTIPRTQRKTLLAVACGLASAMLATPAHAGSLTEFTLTDGHTNVGTMSLDWDRIRISNIRNSTPSTGPYQYNYVGQEIIVNTSGEYLLGQTTAPVDTVMLLYRGSFDPTAPGNGWITGNDDWGSQVDGSNLTDDLAAAGITFVSCSSPTFCPALKQTLEGGARYTVVISTYSPGNDIGFPQSFFVYGLDFVVVVHGPDLVIVYGPDLVVETKNVEKLFEAPVAGSRSQPGGAYLDRVVDELGLRDPNSPLLQALTSLAAMSETERARFVESMSSNVSRSGMRDATVNASRAMLNTVGKRYASTGLGGQMSRGLVAPATYAGHTANRQLEQGTSLGMAPGNDTRSSVLQYGDHDSYDGLVDMASQLSHQGASRMGRASSWAEGFVSRGSGGDYDHRTHGALLGMDHRFAQDWLGGLFLGVSQGRINGSDAANARSEMESVITGAYAARRYNDLIVDTTLLAGFSDNEHRREITGLQTDVVEGSNRGEEITLAIGTSYVIGQADDWELVPHARVMHSWLQQSAYDETGDSAFTMSYGSQRQQVWRTSLGLDAGHVMRRHGQETVLLTGGLAWGMRNQSGGGTQASLSADTTSGSFLVTPDNRTLHSADVNTGLSWERELGGNGSVAISGTYEGSFSHRETQHGARVSMAYHW
ncbi:autotransporter outer membrane beta-barrel domain-containing protein [Halomonas sp. M5N1S17]|uniref:autotransporter outer membrane beta-barrel domain-containing protein n=1 Tax=Halomonas alkalisoli TaxID=2907158 RepID=UPI001F340AC8|nr:autotransporter outer membrane beta-barrel domain-containing protein [Halomonas alkalisoli]MCE9662528.1 autotransporter outer membrane beta-barrel domain-containing protein [Halomonas alkalisoli]